MGWEKVIVERKGFGPKKATYLARVSFLKSGQTKDTTRVSVTISENMLSLMRWKIGEKLGVLTDVKGQKIGLIKADERDPDARILQCPNKKGSTRHGNICFSLPHLDALRLVGNEPSRILYDSNEVTKEGEILVLHL